MDNEENVVVIASLNISGDTIEVCTDSSGGECHVGIRYPNRDGEFTYFSTPELKMFVAVLEAAEASAEEQR
jgi:hypothetical protein